VLAKKVLCVVLAVTVVAMPACSQTTRIITEPDGAEVKVDGLYLGQSPVTYISRSGFPDQSYLEINKDGYEPVKNGVIKKAYRADLSLLLLLAAIVPYFFSARFEDDYRFVLKPLPGTTPPPANGSTEQTPPPANGGTTTPPAGGGTTTPPPSGGTSTPPAGGGH
jgi:hypothetical protein